MIKTVGVYARVSTMDQHPENQAIELRRVAAARGWTIYEDKVFTDHGISGAKGEDERPALRQVMDLARRHKINVVLVWEFSRFARSTTHLLEALNNFRTWNVDFVSVQQNVDTTTANGRLMYGVIALFAEWERENGVERTKLGIQRARAEGKILGRPKIKVESIPETLLRVHGLSLREAERALAAEGLKISKDTISRWRERLLLSQNGG